MVTLTSEGSQMHTRVMCVTFRTPFITTVAVKIFESYVLIIVTVAMLVL
jgi:hypothetical protein